MPVSLPPTSSHSSRSTPSLPPAAIGCSPRPPAAPAPTAPYLSSSWPSCPPAPPSWSGNSTASADPSATWSTPSPAWPTAGEESHMPLTSCMPYTGGRLHDGRYGCRPAGLVVRWAPWLTVVDRWFAAPRRPRRSHYVLLLVASGVERVVRFHWCRSPTNDPRRSSAL